MWGIVNCFRRYEYCHRPSVLSFLLIGLLLKGRLPSPEGNRLALLLPGPAAAANGTVRSPRGGPEAQGALWGPYSALSSRTEGGTGFSSRGGGGTRV
jgi:hypothetical protein